MSNGSFPGNNEMPNTSFPDGIASCEKASI